MKENWRTDPLPKRRFFFWGKGEIDGVFCHSIFIREQDFHPDDLKLPYRRRRMVWGHRRIDIISCRWSRGEPYRMRGWSEIEEPQD